MTSNITFWKCVKKIFKQSQTRLVIETSELRKSYMRGKSEGNTMVEKQKCEYCEKDAIGYQGYGCCSAYVCLDHADDFVLALKPGEKQISGECYFERFSNPE